MGLAALSVSAAIVSIMSWGIWHVVRDELTKSALVSSFVLFGVLVIIPLVIVTGKALTRYEF